MLNDKAKRILEDKTFVHLAVMDGDTPHTSPVWVDVRDDGRILVNTSEGRAKARLLQPGTKVALSATSPENPYDSLLIQGRVVERTHENADADIDRLAKKYLDKDVYPFRQPGEQRVTVIIEPDRIA